MSKKWRKPLPPIRAAKAVPEGGKAFALCGQSPIGIEAADGGERKLPTFQGHLYTGNPMNLAGWPYPVIIDLDDVEVPTQTAPALHDHDHKSVVGHTTSVKVDKEGVHVKGVFSGEQVHVNKIVEPGLKGFPWQMSIGADPITKEFLASGETTTVNGRQVMGPMYISRKTRLGEATFTPLGADGDTSARVAASSKGTQTMSWKTLLKEQMVELAASKSKKAKAAKKYSADEVDAMDEKDAKCALKEAMKASDDDDDDDDDDKKKAKASATQDIKAAVEQARIEGKKAAASEARRLDGISAAVRKHGVTEIEIEEGGKKTKVNLAAHAIENDWTAEQTAMQAELNALRAGRPGASVGIPGGLGYTASNPAMTDAVMECAIFQAGGSNFRLMDKDFYADDEAGRDKPQRRVSAREEAKITRELNARYTDQVQQAAHTMFKGRLGLQQFLCNAAAQEGYRGRDSFSLDGWGAVSQYLARGAQRIEADGGSTISIPNVLSNVQNKYMLQGYMYTEQSFNDVINVLPVKDFKPTKSIALFGDSEFQDLGNNSEIQHGTLKDQPFANQAQLRARMFTIPLDDIINDDLGILGQVPMILGRGWGLKINRLVWTLMLTPGNGDDGAAFFRTTTSTADGSQYNANKATGAGSALSSSSLTTARQLFRKQVDPTGSPLGIGPAILLHPPELETAADELMKSKYIIMAGLASTSSASKQASDNIWQGKYKLVMSAYLSGTFANNSATGWYLLADPSIMPVLQVSALNGAMVPTVQTAGQDFQFNMLGISMRGFGGVGVAVQNFRGGVFMAGA